MTLDLEDKLDIYEKMLQIRTSESKMCELFQKGEIVVAGSTNKNQVGFEKKFQQVVGELRPPK